LQPPFLIGEGAEHAIEGKHFFKCHFSIIAAGALCLYDRVGNTNWAIRH